MRLYAAVALFGIFESEYLGDEYAGICRAAAKALRTLAVSDADAEVRETAQNALDSLSSMGMLEGE